MSVSLSDLADCFEGVIPSIIATCAADGVPNISYLSHVAQVDERHVALSNQFFGKTVDNLTKNPQASVLLVDGGTGRQVRLDVTWVRNEAKGALFEELAANLAATSAQVGMAAVMRLASVDIFRVDAIHLLPHPQGLAPPPRREVPGLPQAAEIIARISQETEAAGIVRALVDGVRAMLACPAAILFEHDAARGALVTLASRGYPRAPGPKSRWVRESPAARLRRGAWCGSTT